MSLFEASFFLIFQKSDLLHSDFVRIMLKFHMICHELLGIRRILNKKDFTQMTLLNV